jgi:uncharacterized OsmC-like protein
MSDAPQITTYEIHGVSHPGGHSRIRANTTDIKADTGSISTVTGPVRPSCCVRHLAACLLKNIERFSEMLPFEYEVASVEVTAERQDAPPRMVRMHYRVEVVTDEPDHRVDLLHRNIRKFGTITNTLAAACDLDGELTARRRTETRAEVHPDGGAARDRESGR